MLSVVRWSLWVQVTQLYYENKNYGGCKVIAKLDAVC